MGILISSRVLRLARKACSRAFWFSLITLGISLYGWLPQSLAALRPVWPMIIVAAVIVYTLAVALGPIVARREFAAAMSGAGGASPMIVCLRSFDLTAVGLLGRVARHLFRLVFGSMYLLFAPRRLVAATAAGVPEDDPGIGFVLGLDRYDVEEELSKAIDARALLVTVGDKRASCGGVSIMPTTGNWPATFRRLTDAALLVVVLPGVTPAALWDAAEIIGSRDLLAKLVLVMPRGGAAKAWSALAATCTSKLGAKLPRYDASGCFLRLGRDDAAEALPLETFALGLGRFLADRATPAAGISDMWNSRYAEQQRGLRIADPKTPSDWAARVATTRFMDDGEELIKRLGGSVDWGSKKATVVVQISGQEHAFDSGMDMVEWIVRELVPKVEAQAAKA